MNPEPPSLLPSSGAKTPHGAEGPTLSVGQVVQLSGISEADLSGLVDYGVLSPITPEREPWTFDPGCVMTLQRAEALRQDLALDAHAFALAVMFLEKISGLEAERSSMQSELCRRRAAEHVDHHPR